MAKTHHYAVTVQWTGNTGSGTADYRSYSRQHEISAGADKPKIPGSADRVFRGDTTRWNPEELLVASLSACHKLTYLHLCADAGIVVVAYIGEQQARNRLMHNDPDVATDANRPEIRVLGFVDAVELEPRPVRLSLQVENRELHLLLLVAG